MSYALATIWFERARFLPAVLAVSFSCLLIAMQGGLLLGLFSITSIPIDNSRADIWVTHPQVLAVDLGKPMPEAYQSYLAMPGVLAVEPYFESFGYWVKPTGGVELSLIIGTRLTDDAIGPINQLTPEMRRKLGEYKTVIVDDSEFGRLGIDGVGATAELNQQRVRVVDTVSGLKSLAGPYVFCSLETARTLVRPPSDQCTFLLAKCESKEVARQVVEKLRAYPTKLAPYTAEEFSFKSRWHWLTKTKAGIALGFAALLGLLVGSIVTSQTLYSATVASLKEYAVLRALGIPRWRMASMVLAQAFWVGIAGVLLAVPCILGLQQVVHQVGAKVLLPDWLWAGSMTVTMVMALMSGFMGMRSLQLVEPVTLLR